MKTAPILLIVLALCSSCSLFGGKPPENVTYVVTDHGSNKVLSAYECDQDDRIVRTRTYAADQTVTRARDFAYDFDGYVREMTELVPGRYTKTITYTNEVILDAEGRIEKIIQKSSDGTTLESFFGYDETGKLRGTVLRMDGDSVFMKDYDE